MPANNRLPMSFSEARDAISELIDDKSRFKTDHERVSFLEGLKLGLVSGRELGTEGEVEHFLAAIKLHLQLYGQT